jgi:hypothetical protein
MDERSFEDLSIISGKWLGLYLEIVLKSNWLGFSALDLFLKVKSRGLGLSTHRPRLLWLTVDRGQTVAATHRRMARMALQCAEPCDD